MSEGVGVTSRNAETPQKIASTFRAREQASPAGLLWSTENDAQVCSDRCLKAWTTAAKETRA